MVVWEGEPCLPMPLSSLVSYNSSPSWKWKEDQIFLRCSMELIPSLGVWCCWGRSLFLPLILMPLSIWVGMCCSSLHPGVWWTCLEKSCPRLREIWMFPINNQLPPHLVEIEFVWQANSWHPRVDYSRPLTPPLFQEWLRDFHTFMHMSARVFNMLQVLWIYFQWERWMWISSHTFFKACLHLLDNIYYIWLYLKHFYLFDNFDAFSAALR